PQVVVGVGQGSTGFDPPTGDLLGQRPQQLGVAHAVFEADGGIRGLVGVGDSAGVLSALPQQIQSDRTVLVDPGAEVGRSDAELFEGDPAGGPTDDLEGSPS